MELKVRKLIWVSIISYLLLLNCRAHVLSPKAWPEQFHAQLYQISLKGEKSIVDLWYDWPNGRNYNIIQHQLSYKLYDVEWTNGTSYYFDLEAKTCKTLHFAVGILRPDWLDDSTYLGVQNFDGFTCNLWEKEDFITYYEDIETQRPVGWYFRTAGLSIHVMTFEPGAVLRDSHWQAPSYCFTDTIDTPGISGHDLSSISMSSGMLGSWNESWKRWLSAVSDISSFK